MRFLVSAFFTLFVMCFSYTGTGTNTYDSDDITNRSASILNHILMYHDLLSYRAIPDDTTIQNFTQMSASHGYPSEEHTVQTADGYILRLFRLKTSARCSGPVRPLPLLLQHGILDSCDTFIISGADEAMAYLFSDECHDVWCSNTRGNHYSNRHVSLSPCRSEEYWNFSFHEQGLYDLPAVVDYVLGVTQASAINYVSHSQGSTNFFVLCSTRPEYNAKFNVVVCMAPVAWLTHLYSPLLKMFISSSGFFEDRFRALGVWELFGCKRSAEEALRRACRMFPEVCVFCMFVFSGTDPGKMPLHVLSAVFAHYPSGTSIHNIFHTLQHITIDRFQQFDFGSEERNLAAYGESLPPQYEVRLVTARVALMCGASDWLVSLQDVGRLRDTLPNVIDFYMMPDERWGHSSFVWGRGVKEILVPKLLRYF
ncbi:hypothetical protein JYU34_020975 [Plutella xylostella]|uniref:Lipase n=1 Tax=Plutella xylostella TaxID=51655 RepID=A0ABQ7PSE2_PLUXY|nr:hypothetical protein JYU34_020975 [Plutella xylostella]